MPEEITPVTQKVPSDERGKASPARDGWEKLESAAKIIAGISIPILGVAVTFILGTQSESHREDQFRANMMAEREKADTEIRAKMFDFLLNRYFSTKQKVSTEDVEDFRTRLMVLRLLLENFQEHLSTRSLFAHLYDQILKAEGKPGSKTQEWRTLKKELIEVGRNTASEQLASLAPFSLKVPDVLVPWDMGSGGGSNDPSNTRFLRIPLYSTVGLTGGPFDSDQSPDPELPGKEDGGKETARYSIRLVVKDIREDHATVEVEIYEDKYVGNKFQDVSLRLNHFTFDASFFSTPYLDNTPLPSGRRFSVIYRGCIDEKERDQVCKFPLRKARRPQAQFHVVVFKSDFLSRRDRPDIDQLLQKSGKSKSGWSFF